MVCRSVCHLVSAAKTAGAIKMLFASRNRVCLGKHLLHIADRFGRILRCVHSTQYSHPVMTIITASGLVLWSTRRLYAVSSDAATSRADDEIAPSYSWLWSQHVIDVSYTSLTGTTEPVSVCHHSITILHTPASSSSSSSSATSTAARTSLVFVESCSSASTSSRRHSLLSRVDRCSSAGTSSRQSEVLRRHSLLSRVDRQQVAVPTSSSTARASRRSGQLVLDKDWPR